MTPRLSLTRCALVALAFALAAPASAQQRVRDSDRTNPPMRRIDARPAPSEARSASGGALLTEDFADAVPPVGWAQFDGGTAGTHAWTRLVASGTLVQDGYARNTYDESGSAVEDYLATPRLAVTSGAKTLTFATWQSYSANYFSQYDVMVSTTSQTDPSAYTSIASWTETTLCPGGNTSEPSDGTAIPNAANCTVDLSAYVGQDVWIAFRHTNDLGDDFNLDAVTAPPKALSETATFTVTPDFYDFGTLEQCATGTQSFSITNDAVASATLSVDAISISGDAAYALTGTSPSPPYTVSGGGSASFSAAFSPTSSGSLSADVTISYRLDGGATQTATVDLEGLGAEDNRAAGAGDGYRYGNSTACAGDDQAAVLAAPFGTAQGDASVTLDDDDSQQVSLTGTYRVFGAPHSAVWVGSDGFLGFGAEPPTYPDRSGEMGTALVQIANLDLDPSSAGDVFVGERDVTGDGVDDLVVTYFRVPINASSSYVTLQLVVAPSATAGANAEVTAQFYNGDAPDGMPYSDVFPFEADAFTVGLVGDQVRMDAFYATIAAPAPTFGGDATVAATFRPRAERVVTGDAGWRLLSHGPSEAPSVAYLVEQNLVQGLADEYPSATGANLLTGYDAGAFAAPTGGGAALTAGKGMFWYFYDVAIDPSATDGVSNSLALPAPLTAGGAPATTAVTTALTAGPDGDGVRFELLGNPFEAPLSTATLGAYFNDASASSTGFLYDTATNGYVATTAAGDEVPVWGGFFVDAGAATEITFPAPSSSSAPAGDETSRLIAFELQGQRPDGMAVADRAATLLFHPDAGPAWDTWDAAKPAGDGARVELAVEGGERDGRDLARGQASFAYAPDTAVRAELSVEAVGTEGDLTLRWDQIRGVPADWALELRDLVTGDVLDLRAATSYTFAAEAAAPTDRDRAADAGQVRPAPRSKAGQPARFVVTVTPANATSGEAGAEAAFGLAPPRPNPTRGTAAVAFSLPQTGPAELGVFDLLGRRVATLAQGELAAGEHQVTLDAAALSAGVYVVRLEAAGTAAVQRLTVLR